MASYHCSIKPVSRGAGRSGTAAAAYRAGVCLTDERTGEVHDYTRKQGIEHTELIFPTGVSLEREQLWNAAEGAEKRKDARVSRELELALPVELTPEQRRELATDFAKSLVGRYGVAADVAVHEPSRKGDQRNHHAHILITTRQISAQGLGEKTDLEREDKALRAQGKPSGREQIEALRFDWATRCNVALEHAGHKERVSHKSLEAQGIDREPTTHLGPVATAMERRGERSERGDLNRGPGEIRAAQAELASAEKVQAGVERMRAQAREWRIVQERARQQALAAEREKQQERERLEREEKERQARQEAESKAQERERLERERAERREQNRSCGRSLGR
jgi:ATP-dependent exoDNAse (exonuclease V) alpha subunit